MTARKEVSGENLKIFSFVLPYCIQMDSLFIHIRVLTFEPLLHLVSREYIQDQLDM